MHHYRKTHKLYISFPKPINCSFCEDDMSARAVRATDYAYVIPNRVSYDLWELRDVTDHLMIIPRQHVLSLGELPDAAKLDILNLMAEYETDGYNIYARALSSTSRSVQHQHTHLIRTKPQRARASLILQRPYLVVKI